MAVYGITGSSRAHVKASKWYQCNSRHTLTHNRSKLSAVTPPPNRNTIWAHPPSSLCVSTSTNSSCHAMRQAKTAHNGSNHSPMHACAHAFTTVSVEWRGMVLQQVPSGRPVRLLQHCCHLQMLSREIAADQAAAHGRTNRADNCTHAIQSHGPSCSHGAHVHWLTHGAVAAACVHGRNRVLGSTRPTGGL